MAIPPDLAVAVGRTLEDLRRVHLTVTTWPAVAGDLARLDVVMARGDHDATRAALTPISQAAFEGKVRGRLAGAGRQAAFVTATKPTKSLPVVGGISGVILLVLGWLLGGVVGLLGSAVFALFIFGVALAGTRTNLARTEERQARRASPTLEATGPAPMAVVEAIVKIEAQLG